MEWSFDTESLINAKSSRAQFVAVLRALGDRNSDFDAAELIYGELMGNVVRHAPGPVTVTLDWSRLQPVLTIHDEQDSFVPNFELPADTMHESGRGLFIVRHLATSLRVRDIEGDGCEVIAQLPVYAKGRRPPDGVSHPR